MRRLNSIAATLGLQVTGNSPSERIGLMDMNRRNPVKKPKVHVNKTKGGYWIVVFEGSIIQICETYAQANKFAGDFQNGKC